MTKYIPITVEECLGFAERARNDGHPEIADVFDRMATKIARFNERSPFTVEELRQQLGDEKFFAIIQGTE